MDLLSSYMAETKQSQADLARLFNVSPVTVHQWIRRECNPSPAVAFEIERLTGAKIPASYWPSRRSDRRRRKSGRKSRAA